jgi:Cu/Ag efflux protein CusF
MLSLAFALLLAGCAGSNTQESSAPMKTYQLRGQIMGLDPSAHVATIKHEEIKGFMGAMTMGYPIKDQAEFAKLSVGEPITATVYAKGDDFWVGNIQKQPQP